MSLSPNTKAERQNVIMQLSDELFNLRQQHLGNGQIKKFIQKKRRVYPWLTRTHLYNRFKTIVRKNNKEKENEETEPNNYKPQSKGKGGRPKQSTAARRLELENKKELFVNELALQYASLKSKTKGPLPHSTYKKLHANVLSKFLLDNDSADFKVSANTIRSRVKRNQLIVDRTRGNPSPLSMIEPILLQFSLWKAQAGQPITPSEGLALANSLIKDKPIEQRLKAFQLSIKKDITGTLSKKYWQGFWKRHKHELETKRGTRRDVNRTNWVTYENVQRMYNLVYDQMVEARVARRLDPEDYYYVDQQGQKISDQQESVGLKVTIEITHPEWILFGDEVGTELSQKDDGNVGGQKFVVGKGCIPNISSSHADSRVTVIGLTAATGDPVMCVIIFAAEELSYEQRFGHDLRAPFNDKGSLRDNTGPGKTYPGPPRCVFRGKEVPAFVGMSPKGSITSELLKQIFQRLDDLGVYKRSPNGPIPFGLFDAHDSRLQLPFLRYINEESHLWKFNIGLPNGTHVWQVGDSNEQNGTWKVEWAREKAKLVLFKTRMGLCNSLERSDIIPLINIIWERSFGNIQGNKKAIADRGWYPANKRLLTNPDILATRQTSTTERSGSSAKNYATSISNDNNNHLSRDQRKSTASTPNAPTSTEQNTPKVTKVTPATTSAPKENKNDSLDFSSMINLSTGVASEYATDLLQYMIRSKACRDNLSKREREGKAIRNNKEEARKLTKITGGQLFKIEHVALDENILAARENKEREKIEKIDNTIKKAIKEYQNRKRDYEQVQNSGKDEKEYTCGDLKALIHFKKRKTDGAVPTTLPALKVRYERVRERTILTLKDYMVKERNFTDEEVDRVIEENSINLI